MPKDYKEVQVGLGCGVVKISGYGAKTRWNGLVNDLQHVHMYVKKCIYRKSMGYLSHIVTPLHPWTIKGGRGLLWRGYPFWVRRVYHLALGLSFPSSPSLGFGESSSSLLISRFWGGHHSCLDFQSHRRCEFMSLSFVWFEVHGIGADNFRGMWYSVRVVCGGVFVLPLHPRLRLVCLCLVVIAITDSHLPLLYCTTLIFLA